MEKTPDPPGQRAQEDPRGQPLPVGQFSVHPQGHGVPHPLFPPQSRKLAESFPH